MHHALGEMEIDPNGILSMQKEDVGTQKVYYDMVLAERMGHFEAEEKIWGPEEWHQLIGALV